MVAATAVATLALAACSGNSTDDATGGGGGNGEPEGNELTVWAWDPAFNIAALQEAEKIYQQDHPDFKLNIVETPLYDLQTNLTTI